MRLVNTTKHLVLLVMEKGGEGTKVAPMIAGKSYEDIVKRLDDYKHNRVPNSLMVGLLNNISDEDLKN